MRILLILVFFFFCASEAQAQDSLTVTEEKVLQYDTISEVRPMELSKETIANYKKDEAFNYTEATPDEDNWWEQFKRWLAGLWFKFWEWLLGDSMNKRFWGFMLKILPYLIIAGIIGFIIWLFYRLNPGAKILKSAEAPDVFFTEEEEIIKTRDIKNLIQKALEEKDYRMAVRYSYLLILKQLSDAHLIDYEFDKTNSDYIAEMASGPLNLQFQKVTNLYDYIWYGSFTVTETDYQVAQRTFQKLEQQLPKTND
ncbi:DUF4129 domain-containing protein [Altibacter lentus]|uniref:DUF4129 domain-containing protein n=1 Tax=Altibacter lentus TaxID=1223410 RepID=UPI0005566B64|nr:DUF4129 domain-containing protein [Altibacter lentus]